MSLTYSILQPKFARKVCSQTASLYHLALQLLLPSRQKLPACPVDVTKPFTLCDPVITYKSPQTFTLWDDCMSFPDLLVRVSRHDSISLAWCDVEGEKYCWSHLGREEAELLQHELDHLDGVLAVDRALDGKAVGVSEDIVERGKFEAAVDWYREQVDWWPGQGEV